MKKILLILCFLGLCIFSYAQQSKLRVAVLDPTTSGIAMDDGTKLAVQELISSTFVNTGRYIIIERSMIDKIIKEQSFQNSDIADNSQATEIGKLAGANKVVLSAVSLVGGRNLLSIKIIDVTTASVDKQKTKIVGSSDLLDAVEPLTLELLGVQAEYVKQNTVFSQTESPKTEEKIKKDASDSSSGSEDIAKEVGQLMTFPDNSKGIIFQKNDDGTGLVVSLDMTTAKWQNAKRSKDCQNITKIPDSNGENMCRTGLGKQYTDAVISQLGYGMAGAAEWCKSHGDGWYLPSAGELAYLFSVDEKTKGRISNALQSNNGWAFVDEWHWSSSENDDDEAINVSLSGWTTSEDKIEVLHVRAVRAF